MGYVSVAWKEYDINTLSMIRKVVSHQPTLRTYLYNSNEVLLDGNFSTMYGSEIEEFPYTGNIGNNRDSVIINDSSINYGVKLKVFGYGNGITTKYFRNDNPRDTINQAITKFPIQKYDEQVGVYPVKIYETDTIEISVESVVKQSATGYTGYKLIRNYQGNNRVLDVYSPDYDSVYLSSLVHAAYIKVYDKTLGTDYTTEYYCNNIAGSACRFGAPDSYIYITLLCLDNYNPKFICDNINSSGYARNLTNKGEMLQKVNGQSEYSSEPGTLSTVLVSFLTDYYTNNNGYKEYFSLASWDIPNFNLDDVFKRMYDPSSPMKLDPSKASFPNRSTNVTYWDMGGIATDIPQDYYVAVESNYQFNVDYIPEYGFRIMARFDDESGRWHIGNVITDYAVPEPEPEPVPEHPPFPFEIPDDEFTQTPSPKNPKDSIMDDIEGPIDGVSHTSNYLNEINTDSEWTDGLNGWTDQSTGVPILNHNYHCYIGSQSTISDLADAVIGFCTDDYMKTLACLTSSFTPDQLFTSIIELPYNLSMLNITTVNATPMLGHTHLARAEEDVDWSNLSSDPNKAVAEAFRTMLCGRMQISVNDFDDILNNNAGLISASFRIGQVQYYPVIQERLVKIPMGTKTIKKIFGNYLDYEMVSYKLQLPLGEIITIDPQLLFRDKYGNNTDQSDITIDGYIDVESGDMLIIVYINEDCFYQTTINVAIERSMFKEDVWRQSRTIAQGLSDIAKGIVTMAGAPTLSSNIGSNTGVDTGADATNFAGTKKNDSAHNSLSYTNTDSNSETLTTHQSGRFNPRETTALARWAPTRTHTDRTSHSDTITGTSSRDIGRDTYSGTDARQFMRSNKSAFANETLNRTSRPLEGALGIASGVVKIASSGNIKPIAMSVGQSAGSLKIIGNLLPIFIYEYPDIITPNRKDGDGVWQMNYNYVMLNGLPSATLNIGIGYNKYGSISKIDNKRAPGITHSELSKLENALLGGFYINNDSNIYVQPSISWAPYTNVRVEGLDVNQNLYENNLEYVSLFTIDSGYEKYADKLLITSVANSINNCYKCIVSENQEVENPEILVSAMYYTGQNYALYNGRCYKIMDVIFEIGNMCRFILQEDYLATWLNRVTVEGIIVRSSAYFNADIHDVTPMTSRRIMKKMVYTDSQQLLNNTHTIIALSSLAIEYEPLP